MFDPRTDLIGLFTNSRIGAACKYSTVSVYVKLINSEDDKEAKPSDYGSKYVGIMWFKPPRAYFRDMDLGFQTTEHEVIVDCDLVIPTSEKWLEGVHSTYINNILHIFETTIRTNSTVSGKSWDIARADAIPISFDSTTPNIYRRVVEVICRKAN